MIQMVGQAGALMLCTGAHLLQDLGKNIPPDFNPAWATAKAEATGEQRPHREQGPGKVEPPFTSAQERHL